jgi:hypothetical protein
MGRALSPDETMRGALALAFCQLRYLGANDTLILQELRTGTRG